MPTHPYTLWFLRLNSFANSPGSKYGSLRLGDAPHLGSEFEGSRHAVISTFCLNNPGIAQWGLLRFPTHLVLLGQEDRRALYFPVGLLRS